MSTSQPSRGRLALLTTSVAIVPAAPACGAAGAAQEETTGGTTGMMGETTGMAASGVGASAEPYGGTWQVDDSGTVDFRVQGGSLDLQSADANSGWKKRVAADRKDEIEVHFTKDDTDWKFEAEISDDDGFEVSRERDTQLAEGGTYDLSDAATAKFSVNDGSLSLDSFDAKDGWSVTKRDESTDDIEVSLKNGNQTAEFEVERTGGQTKLETSQKVTGPKLG